MGSPIPMALNLYDMRDESPLWLDDGNLVLATTGVVFRVHRGIMERQSKFFRDLLSLPQPNDAPEFDGTPVIQMYDEPRDLECFILALYDGLYFKQIRASNFSIICGVLRLSIKYLVEHLRVECLKLLQHDWPRTLAGWDLRERESTNHDGGYESSVTRPHPIFVINFAYELGPSGASLLPAAFYDLSRYNCSHIWAGCSATTNDQSKGYHAEKLSPPEIATVMLGKEASQSFIARFLRRELEDREIAVLCEHGTNDNGMECRGAFDDLAHEIYRAIVGVTCGRDSDPLFTLDAAVLMQHRGEDGGVGVHPASRACEQCRAEFAQVAIAARRYVWDQLPCWFGLEDILQGAEGV